MTIEQANECIIGVLKNIRDTFERESVNRKTMNIAIECTERDMDRKCKWTKGLHSFETCWGDVSIKDYKKYAMEYCPKCGKRIDLN